MKLEKFIENFRDLFEETDPETINKDTNYEDLDEWSSILGLMVLGMVNQEYSIEIGAKEIIESATVEDLFNTISLKKNAQG